MFTLALALIGAPALADAQVSFQSDMPVRFYVDGARISSTANLKPVELALTPGEHTLRVETMLGRTLHDEVIDVTDGQEVDARWRFRELEMRSSGGTEAAAVAAPEVEEREPQVYVAPTPEEAILAIPATGEVIEEIPEEIPEEIAVAPEPEPEILEPEVLEPEPEVMAASLPVAEVEPVSDGLILVGPEAMEEAILEEPLDEAPAAAPEDGFVTSGIQLADGELHISITQGTGEGTRTFDIAVTNAGVHVFDSEGKLNGSVDLRASAPEVDDGALSEVVFVSRDGRWANLYVDGALAAYITNDGEATLELAPGIHDVEIRDSRGRQVWHHGALTVAGGQAMEIGFARDLPPQVMGQQAAWETQEPIGLR